MVSPSPPQDDVDDTYSDDNSLDEVDATLNNLDEELEDTEQALTEWSRASSYSSGGPTFSSATGTFTYTGSYTGSPSFVSLPTFSPRSPPHHVADPIIRLSKITERTEDSRPSSTALSAATASRSPQPTPDHLRRSAFGGGTSSHSRSATDPSSDRTLPPPGRLNELIAVFETQSPSATHSRTASTPGFRPASPMFGTGPSMTTGYSYSSRPSSPSKSATASSGSYTNTDARSNLLSPPRPMTSSGFRSGTSGTTRTGTFSSHADMTSPSFASHSNSWNNTTSVTPTASYTVPHTESRTYTETGRTYTDTETASYSPYTPTSGLRRPQTSPRSPLASVRNIVALWKERTPAAGLPGEKSAPGSVSSISPPRTGENDSFHGVRRRVEGARAMLRESRMVSNPPATPVRPPVEDTSDNASLRRSGVFPPGFDMTELTSYAQSKEPVCAEC